MGDAAHPLIAMFIGLLGVMAVLVVMVTVIRYLQGRTAVAAGRGEGLRVIASRTVGWQCAVVVVEAGEEQFVLGLHRNGMTRLGRLRTRIEPPAPDFGRTLRRRLKRLREGRS